MEQHVKMPRSVLSDKSLSLKAKGLYALILSLPTSWNCSIKYLVEESGVSKHIIWKTVQELEKKGYLERHQMNDEGRFCGMEYVLKERPSDGKT